MLIDQVHCIFTPHVVGIRVGQPLRVLNSDRCSTTSTSLPFEQQGTNIGLPHAARSMSDLHDAGSHGPDQVRHPPVDGAWIGVLDHPYFAITNEIGSFVIPDLPPGKYVVEAWHEKYVSVAMAVEVSPGGDVPLDFLLDARKP